MGKGLVPLLNHRPDIVDAVVDIIWQSAHWPGGGAALVIEAGKFALVFYQ